MCDFSTKIKYLQNHHNQICEFAKMTYECITCGTKKDYDEIIKDGMLCVDCTVKRSNIWVKKRPKGMVRVVIAR